MRKLTTLFSMVAIACALSLPAFAAQATTGDTGKTKMETTSKSKSKTHKMHAKKKGETEGKKKGQ